MTIVRFLAVAWVLAVAGVAQAQSHWDQPGYTPDLSPGTYFALDAIRTLEILGAVALVIGIPGWIILKLWADSRRAKDPVKLAMADPWMRAKLEAMSEQERAEFLAQIGK